MDLPDGTVTFLFTDVEGSTKLLHELGPVEYAEALAEHRRALRATFAAHDGVEVDTQGDAFFVAFARASDAVAAATAGQAALDGGPIRVRMGLHTGEPVLAAESYVGMDVHRAARIAGVAHGGQVVLSDITGKLVPEASLRDLGAHRLKDLGEPLRLFQLGNEEFPPLRSLNETTLPVQPTPLVGRSRELGEVIGLLRKSRLVTLTGAGGSGKTRLALGAAAELVDDHLDGVHWVSLAGLSSADQVEPAIARALGVGDELPAYLAGKKLLLLLDNFEHLLDAAPRVGELLTGSPGLRVLATSRERLALAGEQEYPVPQLSLSEAVELFVAHAHRLDPAFVPDESVAAICRRVDGLPLAIELAAARVKILTPVQILDRLGMGIDLLASSSRDVPARQRTLRAAIEWSHDLLTTEEQRLYARLSVFAGGWPLEASELVCDADLEPLASLVDKSLVRRGSDGRFFMLQTIRDHAAERLGQSEEAEELARRHGRWCLELARGFKTGGVATDARVAAIEREHDNMSAAVERALEESDPTLGLELVASLWHLWDERGRLLEAERWANAALARSAAAPPPLRIEVTTAAARFAQDRGDFTRSRFLFEEVLALARASDDTPALASALSQLGRGASLQGDHDRSLRLHEEAVELRRQGTDRERLGGALYLHGVTLADQGNASASLDCFREAAEILAAEESEYGVAVVRQGIGWALLVGGDYAASLTVSADGIRLMQVVGDTYAVTLGLGNVATALMRLGLWADGARLGGASDALHAASGYAVTAAGVLEGADTDAAARAALGDAEFERLSEEGARLELDAAVQLALELSAAHGAPVD